MHMTAAALSFNKGAAFIADTFKMSTGRSPGILWKVDKCKKQRMTALQRKVGSKHPISTPKRRVVACRITFHYYGNKD